MKQFVKAKNWKPIELTTAGGSVPENVGLLVDGLCKNYGTIGVYSHVSFCVKKGECFGILGGAGKSAVFRTLTGQQVPSVGDAHIPPYSMLHNRRKVRGSNKKIFTVL